MPSNWALAVSASATVLPSIRMPSVDRGVQSFIWAVVFFLVLYLGMVAIAVSKATALVLSLVVAFLVFLLVRTRGEPDPRDQR